MTYHSIDVNYYVEIDDDDGYREEEEQVCIDFSFSCGEVEFVSCSVRTDSGKWVEAPEKIRAWAIKWLDDDGHEDAIQKVEDDCQPAQL